MVIDTNEIVNRWLADNETQILDTEATYTTLEVVVDHLPGDLEGLEPREITALLIDVLLGFASDPLGFDRSMREIDSHNALAVLEQFDHEAIIGACEVLAETNARETGATAIARLLVGEVHITNALSWLEDIGHLLLTLTLLKSSEGLPC